MVPKRFRDFSEYREVTGTPRGVNGPYWALVEDRRRRPGGGRPPKPNPNWGGGPGPPFLLSLLPFLPSPTPTMEGGILLPPGVGLPPWARLGGRPGEDARQGRGAILLQVGFAPPPIPTRRRGKEEVERRKQRGAPPPP